MKDSSGRKKSSRKRSYRDDDDSDRRERDRDRDRRKRRKHQDSNDDCDASSSSSSSSSCHRTSRKRKKGRRREEKRGKKDGKRDRKKRSKKHKRSKHSSKSRSRSRSSSRSSSRRRRSNSPHAMRQGDDDDPLRRNHELASALQTLLSTHPKLSTELPIILIRMAGGTTFNLSSMPDTAAARGLEQVFTSLGRYGVKLDGTGSWMWDDGTGGAGASARRPGAELFLLKLVRSLLDGIGITAEAASSYEERRRREREAVAEDQNKMLHRSEEAERGDRYQAAMVAAEAKSVAEERDDGSADRAKAATRSLLERYAQKAGDAETSSLPSELGGIVNLILEGESIVLDGLPDEDLRGDLERLFTTLGLVKAEIEEDSGDEDEDDDDGPVMGFSLPDDSGALARASVLAVLDECRDSLREEKGSGGAEKKRVIGPAMGPPPGFSASQALQEYAALPAADDSDDEDDEGPAPIGSDMAKKRQRIGQSISADAVRVMAEHRRMELADVAAGGTGVPSASVAGGREEWMLTPGKHDFLKGIKSADPCKSRKFKNEKVRGGGPNAVASEAGPQLSAQQQAEMEAIRRRVEEARGPTLIEQHKQKKAEETEAAKKSGRDKDFKWNRDRDLDAGRRVDKDHLHMVLGGAKEGLKDKFHYSRGSA
mmetsp:Transcript_4050/g.8736  ORF Transcript_4050/g.8736 Transcript_4050/m.8736 type:complete len:654 (-) Transcript_4050:249-2210(-)